MELYKYLEELYLNNTPITLKSLVNTIYNLENLVFFDTRDYFIKKFDRKKCDLRDAYLYVEDEMGYSFPRISFIIDDIRVTLHLTPYNEAQYSDKKSIMNINTEILIIEIEKEMFINDQRTKRLYS